MIGGVAVRSPRTTSAKTAALPRRASQPAPECAAGARAADRATFCRLQFFSETKSLTQPEIQRKSPWSGQKIDGQGFLAWLRIRIKTSERGLLHGWRIRRAGSKRSELLEQKVAEWIVSSGDVERPPRQGYQEWAQS